MVTRLLLATIAIAMAVMGGLAGPAWSQAAGKSAHALDLDAAPNGGAAPDPLAPPEVIGPAPAAPGAPVAATEAKPAIEVDPIVALVRQRLATAPTGGSAGDREDYAGLCGLLCAGHRPAGLDEQGRLHERAPRRHGGDPQGR